MTIEKIFYLITKLSLQSHTQTETHIEIDTKILTDTHILQIIKSPLNPFASSKSISKK